MEKVKQIKEIESNGRTISEFSKAFVVKSVLTTWTATPTKIYTEIGLVIKT
jgi:hypothetical protein